MKALVKYARGKGNMEIREVPEPVPGKGQVKIEVKAAGICGSDLHIYNDDILIPINPPVIIGHEFSGQVVEVGDGAKKWKDGDRVVSETAYSFCGGCELCLKGNYNLCDNRRTLGYWYNGVFSKYTVVPSEKLHKLPDKTDFTEGALIEPLACITHAVLELTHIIAGDFVLVSGPGAIGLLAMQVVKSQGTIVIVSGTSLDKERLDKAMELGADFIIDVTNDNLIDLVNKVTMGRGVDVVIECSGSPNAIDDGLRAVKKSGFYTQIGLFGKPVTIDFERICYKEIKTIGSLGSRWSSWERAIKLVEQGKVKLAPLISHSFSINEWDKAFNIFEKRQGLKILLMPE